VNVLQVTRPQRVLGITVQCKTREPKEKPREGLKLSGPYRVSEFRNYANARITTRCVDKGDNSRFLSRCDIGATLIGRPSGESPRHTPNEKEPRPPVPGLLRGKREDTGSTKSQPRENRRVACIFCDDAMPSGSAPLPYRKQIGKT